MYYFERQRVDEAGSEAVRLQKLILLIITISIIGRLLDMTVCILTGFWSWSFFIGIVGWFILSCGFFGAALRSRSLLAIFIVLSFMWIIFRGVMLPFVFIRLIGITECATGGHCNADLHLGKASATVVIILSIIETIMVYLVWFLMIHACVVAYRVRKLLKIERIAIYEADFTHPSPPQVLYAYQSTAQQPPPTMRQV